MTKPLKNACTVCSVQAFYFTKVWIPCLDEALTDQEFDDYCTEDDYYQPVVEDFEAEEYAREWAEERNIKLVSFEGEGSGRGFEPKQRRWR